MKTSTPDTIAPAHLAAMRRAFPDFKRKSGYYAVACQDGQRERTESAWDGGSRDYWVVVTPALRTLALPGWHSGFANPTDTGWARGERWHVMTPGGYLVRLSIVQGKALSVTLYYVPTPAGAQ